jgi:hypothetical protein
MGRAAVDSLRVEVGSGSGGLGLGGMSLFASVAEMASGFHRLTVRARVPVPDALALLTGPVEFRSETTCVVGTWKAPWTLLNGLLKMPDPRSEKGSR